MALCQHVNNVFCTLCNIFWFCHLWLIFMTLLFRKLVNKTDIFLVAFLFLEPSTPCKKQKYMHYWYYVNWYFKLKNLQAMKLVVAYCPEVKLLPACLTCQFSGQMEDWSFMLTSHSENMYKCITWKSICSWVLCLLFKTTRRHIVLFALFNVSYGYLFSCSPLWLYTGSLEVKNSGYAPWICFVQWLLVFCCRVKCHVFWRLLKLIKLVYFPVDVLVLYSDEWRKWGV